LLEVAGLAVSYGTIPAVRAVDIDVGAGEAVALLGRNGAGKTSTLRAVAGLVPARAGHIRLEGRDVSLLPAERRARLGIALAPEGRAVFPGLSVRDNLAMGAYSRRLGRAALAREIERVADRFPRLADRSDQAAGSLSGGEQQMLAIARGLMSAPRLLLIDEPSLGLAPLVVEQVYELLAQLRTEGLTIVVVEQYVDVALEFADRAYVLEKGRVALAGRAAELAAAPELVETYLASRSEGAHA